MYSKNEQFLNFVHCACCRHSM